LWGKVFFSGIQLSIEDRNEALVWFMNWWTSLSTVHSVGLQPKNSIVTMPLPKVTTPTAMTRQNTS
jgi:hypothetical protein